MSEIHVTLPDHLDEFVREEAERQGFAAPGEYIQAIIQAERKRKTREWLEAELLKGLDSGPGIEVTEEFWEELRENLRKRHAQKQNAQTV